jgi:hypothetical protein
MTTIFPKTLSMQVYLFNGHNANDDYNYDHHHHHYDISSLVLSRFGLDYYT